MRDNKKRRKPLMFSKNRLVHRDSKTDSHLFRLKIRDAILQPKAPDVSEEAEDSQNHQEEEDE